MKHQGKLLSFLFPRLSFSPTSLSPTSPLPSIFTVLYTQCKAHHPCPYHWWEDGQCREAVFLLLLLVLALFFPCSFLSLIPFSILGQSQAAVHSGVSLLQCGSPRGTVPSQGYLSMEPFSSKVLPSPVLFHMPPPVSAAVQIRAVSPFVHPHISSSFSTCQFSLVSPPELPAPAVPPSLSTTEWSNFWEVGFVVGAAGLGSCDWPWPWGPTHYGERRD